MALVLRNTHRLIEGLKESGFDERQAAGIVEVLEQIDLSSLATKGDIEELKKELLRMKADIFKWAVPLFLGQVAVFAGIVEWLGK